MGSGTSRHLAGLVANGFPTFGDRTRLGFVVTIETGRFSFGSLRESENAPLADRCLPMAGLRMPPW